MQAFDSSGGEAKKKKKKKLLTKKMSRNTKMFSCLTEVLFFEQVYYRKLLPCSEFGVIFLNKTSFIPSTFGVALVSHTWVPAEPCWW